MFEKLKGNILFKSLLKRPDISKAYKMVNEKDSWYDTISTVHKSLEKIQKREHSIIEIESHDDFKLKAVYYPNNSEVTVICVHGYRSHAEREWAFPGLFYLSLGYNLLIPYQRAHGLSEGKYISFGALEYLDMQRWVDKVNEITPNSKIIIHGLSMGGGITLDLANIEMNNVKCLISDAPSVSIKEFFNNIAHFAFKKDATAIANIAIKRFEKEFNCNIEDFEGKLRVSQSNYPILFSAGELEEHKTLFEELKKLNPMETDIIILPGCNHGNGMYKQTNLYQNKIKEFINRYL